MTVLGALTSPVATIWNGVASQAWDPLVSLCRNGTLAQLKGIKIGSLALHEDGVDKPATFFGNKSPEHPFTSLTVHDERFWVRLALFADMVGSQVRQGLRELRSQREGFRGKLYAGRSQLPRPHKVL
jgi:cyclopropane-fatty-acyl-phospholipid synthase